jgi:3-dehydroquinate synthase
VRVEGGVPAGESRPLPRVPVRIGSGEVYPVIVVPGGVEHLPRLLSELAPAHHYAVVADATVAGFHGAAVRDRVGATGAETTLHTFPPGEGRKTRATWARLTDDLLASGVGRDGCVVALGGGVTGDLAGFVAATYMRGIPVVQLPTSLVAMIDSAVGGKTGIDVPAGKNLVGAFHPPRFVLADPELAATLPRAERAQGLAEAVKHGAIVDGDYLERLVVDAGALLQGETQATTAAVLRSVEIKAGVVSQDEREGGLRQVLNFGHTLGHALEQTSGYRIPHGSAVALGMVLEARVGEALGVTAPGTSEALGAALHAFGFPVEASLAASPDAVLQATRLDKKARGGRVRYVLLEALGKVAGEGGWSREVDEAVVRGVLGASGA